MRALVLLSFATLLLLPAGCGASEEQGSGGSRPPRELTIAEALASNEAGPVLVTGTVIAVEGQPVRLCSAILESFPPQCGGPSLVVEGLDLERIEGIVSSAHDPTVAFARWSNGEVSVVGRLVEKILRVDAE